MQSGCSISPSLLRLPDLDADWLLCTRSVSCHTLMRKLKVFPVSEAGRLTCENIVAVKLLLFLLHVYTLVASCCRHQSFGEVSLELCPAWPLSLKRFCTSRVTARLALQPLRRRRSRKSRSFLELCCISQPGGALGGNSLSSVSKLL